uniref:Uncharacterized protein n=1 Tax=Anguilla anguilla TaxID=7936 RepID=A0A0E9UIB7_ANGAN
MSGLALVIKGGGLDTGREGERDTWRRDIFIAV